MLNAGQDKRISIYQTYSVFVPLFSKPKIILYFIIFIYILYNTLYNTLYYTLLSLFIIIYYVRANIRI